ncbi:MULTISPECIES: PKD domain-containing protein [unclassified Carboxylicivirga]|uniref:PKD domain-containing protein n=1 Tax=Carboxylicivirga TaxID=1628153 RepID=UPI003D332B22
MLCLSACEQDIDVEAFPPKDVEFSYHSESLHYVIGEEITFVNESQVGSTYEWHFGDGSKSQEDNPVHKYTVPGTYNVKLIVDGGKYELVKAIMISDIVPIVSFKSDDASIVFNQSEVLFDVFVMNPEGLDVSYKWRFPEGTTGDKIDDALMSTAKDPKAVFGTLGSQVVNLTVQVGEKVLDPVTVNVQVNYNKPVKTLYYAVKEGNILANKIIEGVDPSVNKPFDFSYRSGKHPLTLQFNGDYLYVFDAGTYTSYTAGAGTAGDGEIFAITHDGSRRETVIDNFGGHTYNDFYYGCVEGESIYWTDRNAGVYKVSASTRNMKFSTEQYSHYFHHSWLWYYGNGIGWGRVNGPFLKADDVFYYGKNSNGSGIFRFREEHIGAPGMPGSDPNADGLGAIAISSSIRGMAIDKVNGKIYYSNAKEGDYKLFKSNLDGTDEVVVDASPGDGEGAGTEKLYITGIAVDVDEQGNGYVYWAYRGPEVPAGVNPEEYYNQNPLHKSGIKRISLTDATAKVEYFVEGVEAYGIAIDNTKR